MPKDNSDEPYCFEEVKSPVLSASLCKYSNQDKWDRELQLLIHSCFLP